MAFTNANSTMDEYIDFMAAQLIATGVWAAVDLAFYPAGATPAIRVLKPTADATPYVRLERIVSNSSAGNTRVNEIRATFSTTYDAGAHTQGGTTQICGIPMEMWALSSDSGGGNYNLNNSVGSGNKPLQHFTWVDPTTGSITGVVIAGANATTYDFIAMYSLERNTVKQYNDGFTNVYWVCFPAQDPPIGQNPQANRYFANTVERNGNSQGVLASNYARPIYFHAFNGTPTFDEGIYAETTTGTGYGGTPFWQKTKNSHLNIGRYPGFETFMAAHRSQGDSKAYFMYPWYSNNADALRRSFIAQTEFWFDVGDTDTGLSDGDIIDYTAPGPLLKRYLVKRLPTQDAAGNFGGILDVAIRFA